MKGLYSLPERVAHAAKAKRLVSVHVAGVGGVKACAPLLQGRSCVVVGRGSRCVRLLQGRSCLFAGEKKKGKEGVRGVRLTRHGGRRALRVFETRVVALALKESRSWGSYGNFDHLAPSFVAIWAAHGPGYGATREVQEITRRDADATQTRQTRQSEERVEEEPKVICLQRFDSDA
jgi:hypothetical protein